MKSWLFVLGSLCAAAAYAQPPFVSGLPETMPPEATGGTLMRGVPASNLPGASHHGGGSVNLIDHGGRILPVSKVYYIWWGSGGWPSDANSGLSALASGLTGSAFMSDIFPQYMRGAGAPTTSLVASFTDTSAPPSKNPSTSTIINEACKVIGSGAVDPSALYVVLTSNFPSNVNYCAWHAWGKCANSTTEIQVAYMPNTAGVQGCVDPVLTCGTYSQGTQSIANVLSHEFSESITDADGSAWYDQSVSEIGDKCAWQFASCVNLKNGSSWQLQMEWSNAANAGKGACIQQ